MAGILEVTGVDTVEGTVAAVMVSMAEGLVDMGEELVDMVAARVVGMDLHQTLEGALSEIMAEDRVMGADRITELDKVMGVDKISELDKAGEWGGLGRQD